MKLIPVIAIILFGCADLEKEITSEPEPEPEENVNETESNDESLCPTVDEDECMTSDLYDECVSQEATCEGNIISYGECPYEGWDCQ